ncbi:hypothetical protein ACFHW2_33045 [Actinomadura sp. LOL_016]|uniref:hypothetical protein n=1 Tax=unclassified Actinomadura TaxID=2626254 RepID=UPI003A7F71CB
MPLEEQFPLGGEPAVEVGGKPVRLDIVTPSGFLAEPVAEHRLTEDEAFETAAEPVTVNPRRAFKL